MGTSCALSSRAFVLAVDLPDVDLSADFETLSGIGTLVPGSITVVEALANVMQFTGCAYDLDV